MNLQNARVLFFVGWVWVLKPEIGRAVTGVDTTATPISRTSTESLSEFIKPVSGQSGIYHTLDFDPAALKDNRIRFSSEYVITDGFAFGGQLELDKSKTQQLNQQTFLLGLGCSQYFTSQTLKGFFVHGEISPFIMKLDQYRLEETERNYLIGASMGMDAGYRHQFAKKWTSAATYGVRKNLPDFFKPIGNETKKASLKVKDEWEFRVGLTLGVAI